MEINSVISKRIRFNLNGVAQYSWSGAVGLIETNTCNHRNGGIRLLFKWRTQPVTTGILYLSIYHVTPKHCKWKKRMQICKKVCNRLWSPDTRGKMHQNKMKRHNGNKHNTEQQELMTNNNNILKVTREYRLSMLLQMTTPWSDQHHVRDLVCIFFFI